MYLAEAIEIFDERNKAGRVWNLTTSTYTTVSEATRDGLVSSVRVALRRASGQAIVEQLDLRPYLETLHVFAAIHGKEEDQRKPSNAADRVRRFIRTIEGKTYSRARGGRKYVLPDWLPLYDALAPHSRSRKEKPSEILRLQTVALAGGSIRSPLLLPDRATVVSWSAGLKIKPEAQKRMLDAYALACRELSASGHGIAYPSLEVKGRADQRGLFALPDLMDRLRAAGYGGSTLPRTREVLEILAPKFALALKLHLENPANASLTAQPCKRRLGAVSRIVSELIRHGEDVAVLSPLDLVERMVVGEGSTAFNPLVAAELGTGVASNQVPLLRVIVDRAALASEARSPLKVHSAVGSTIGLATTPTFYTEGIRSDVDMLEVITRDVYRQLQKDRPELWQRLTGAYSELVSHMDSHDHHLRLLNQKDKPLILEQVTYPQLVCSGLPALAAHVRKLQKRYHTLIKKPGVNRSSPSVARARREYATWLRRYIVLAVMASDGLRVQNYSGGRVGSEGHFRPEVARDPQTGRWRKITSVTTHWRGFDESHVALKNKKDENGVERTRHGRTLSPVIVDHDLLLDYWTDVRVDDLVSAGLLSSRSAYDPDTDQFALFVSPRSRKPDGRYGTSAFTLVMGRALHWVCTKSLGRTAVPAWASRDRTTRWRALLSGHIMRLLIATYWGGIRGKWSIASTITDDSLVTLMRSYSKVSMRMAELKRVKGPENPHFFDATMDSIEADAHADHIAA